MVSVKVVAMNLCYGLDLGVPQSFMLSWVGLPGGTDHEGVTFIGRSSSDAFIAKLMLGSEALLKEVGH